MTASSTGTKKLTQLVILLKVLQNLHPGIKFEHCASKTAVDYLGITVKVKDDKTVITVFIRSQQTANNMFPLIYATQAIPRATYFSIYQDAFAP